MYTKALMLSDPDTWNLLLGRIADICGTFLQYQLRNRCVGHSTVRLVGGALSARDYERAVLPHSRKVFEAVAKYETPRIHFGVGTSELLALMQSAGANVMGVDFRLPLNEAIKRLNHPSPLQGKSSGAVRELVSRLDECLITRRGGGVARPHLQPWSRSPTRYRSRRAVACG